MRARYADGRIAATREVECAITPEGVLISTGAENLIWPYDDLERADDGNGAIILRRRPDTGERLTLDPAEADPALRAAAPALYRPQALGVERPRTVIAVAAAAWSLATAFLVGVPLAAAPIAAALPERYRTQIADISWSQVDAVGAYCDDSDEASRILNGVADRMMAAAHVPQRDSVWITLVDAPFPNAFALPDNSIIVTDDLIALADDPDEVTGVIAHEIAHIEHNHIMTNIIRQVGAGIFFDVVFGGAGAGQAIAIASVNLAGLRYSRSDEADADARGLDYLDAAGIDPGALARLFDRLAEQGGGDVPVLISSHPATAARAAAARARARSGLAPSLTDVEWRIVRSACGGSARPAAPEQAPAAPAPAPAPAPGQPPPEKPPETLEGGGK